MDTERLKFIAGLAIDWVSDVRIRRQDMDDAPMVVGIYFNCPDVPRKEFAKAWAEEILEKAADEGLMNTDSPNFNLVHVSLEACGGQATYRTAEEVPLINVPCPCGDPNHWLVKWNSRPAEVLKGQ